MKNQILLALDGKIIYMPQAKMFIEISKSEEIPILIRRAADVGVGYLLKSSDMEAEYKCIYFGLKSLCCLKSKLKINNLTVSRLGSRSQIHPEMLKAYLEDDRLISYMNLNKLESVNLENMTFQIGGPNGCRIGQSK